MLNYIDMTNINSKKVIIIGGGIGGLCTAARLLKDGYEVKIYEKEPILGGRAHRINQEGYTFDMGPTLLMMTDVLYETFSYCGKNFDDYVELIQLEPNYQVTFANHKSIVVSSNMAKLSGELSRFDEKAPEQFYRYIADVAQMYRVSRDRFIDKNFNNITDFINVRAGFELFKKTRSQ